MALPSRLPNHLDETAWAKLKHKKDEGLKDGLKQLNKQLGLYAGFKNTGGEAPYLTGILRYAEELIATAKKVLKQPELSDDVEFFCEKAVAYGQSIMKMALDEKKDALQNASQSEKAVAAFLAARATLHKNLTQGYTRITGLAKAAVTKAKEAQALAAKFVTDFEAPAHLKKIQDCVTAADTMAGDAETAFAPLMTEFENQRQEGGFKAQHGIGPEEAKQIKLADSLWPKMTSLLKDSELAMKNTRTAAETAKSCEDSYQLKYASSKQGKDAAMVVARKMVADNTKTITQKLGTIDDALRMNTSFGSPGKGPIPAEIANQINDCKTAADPADLCGKALTRMEMINTKFKDTIKRVLTDLKTVREMHDNVYARIKKDQYYTYLSELGDEWMKNDLEKRITGFETLVKTEAPKEKADIEKGITTLKKALQLFEKQAKGKKK